MRSHATRKPAHKTSALPASAAVDYFRRKLEFEIGPYELNETMNAAPDKYFVIDVRHADSYEEGHIPIAHNIPLAALPGKLGALPKGKTIVTYCGDITCRLSSKAALELAQKGFKVRHLFGGIAEWQRKGYDVATGEYEPTWQPDRPVTGEEAGPSPEEAIKKEEGEGGPME